ncbi:hypothetical protein ACIRQQ_36245 [Streptomyces fuscichromogenes]|uniref:hypothetical protein n=1 Tax=Streptomyces fuscichromogenes TaxID=1324013 RepID=UPI00380539D0
MGERRSHDADRGRRSAHIGGTVPGPGLEAALAAALREDGVDTEGEQRAMTAFRTARDTGAHRARPRRRDDWRPTPAPAT